ncbi:hypothetical protein KSE_66050 [Kitasatospora setae KM-6054]|uniref:DUF6879 domain-containing protein n=2 Tax=Streptomycetaceae TaxID=2062 RepID=E4N2I0_KITSK|nr:DUF6879 family protein [Kitasatospora sp. SID7827]BAJ32364.1 hypothetical protein KSE_66050 [Kitasatospora setae KM-6054]
MERSAWRLETRPVYTMPQEAEAIRRFQEGRPVTAADTAAWTERLQGYRSTGRTVGRVHVVTRPLTDYLRFEFAHYWHNVGAGEDVRILDLTDRENPGLPDQDFWLFDDSRVVLMNYRPDGTQISREVFEGDHRTYVDWKRLAIAESVPFAEYMKSAIE